MYLILYNLQFAKYDLPEKIGISNLDLCIRFLIVYIGPSFANF